MRLGATEVKNIPHAPRRARAGEWPSRVQRALVVWSRGSALGARDAPPLGDREWLVAGTTAAAPPCGEPEGNGVWGAPPTSTRDSHGGGDLRRMRHGPATRGPTRRRAVAHPAPPWGRHCPSPKKIDGTQLQRPVQPNGWDLSLDPTAAAWGAVTASKSDRAVALQLDLARCVRTRFITCLPEKAVRPGCKVEER